MSEKSQKKVTISCRCISGWSGLLSGWGVSLRLAAEPVAAFFLRSTGLLLEADVRDGFADDDVVVDDSDVPCDDISAVVIGSAIVKRGNNLHALLVI